MNDIIAANLHLLGRRQRHRHTSLAEGCHRALRLDDVATPNALAEHDENPHVRGFRAVRPRLGAAFGFISVDPAQRLPTPKPSVSSGGTRVSSLPCPSRLIQPIQSGRDEDSVYVSARRKFYVPRMIPIPSSSLRTKRASLPGRLKQSSRRS